MKLIQTCNPDGIEHDLQIEIAVNTHIPCVTDQVRPRLVGRFQGCVVKNRYAPASDKIERDGEQKQQQRRKQMHHLFVSEPVPWYDERFDIEIKEREEGEQQRNGFG